MGFNFGTLARAFLFSAFFLVSGCGLGLFNGGASNDRNWQEQFSRLALAEWRSESEFVMRDLRAWEFGPSGPIKKDWIASAFDLNNVRGIWFFFSPFRPGDDLGHTFVTFELVRNGRPDFLTLSIEARREVGEEYSPLRGLFGAYDLAFVWSTEKDIFTNTALALNRDLEMYKVNVSAEHASQILKAFVERSDQLAKKPELYNTVESNCASELALVINRLFGEKIPPHRSFRRTGQAAGYLHSLGYIEPSSVPFADLQEAANIAPLIRTYQFQADPWLSDTVRKEHARLAVF